MLASGGDIVAFRIRLNDLDIRGQAGAGEDPFQQVVAEQAVLGDATVQRTLVGIHGIDALAREGALAEQVLIEIRHRSGVDIHAAGGGKQALVARALAADGQRGRHAGLENGVPADHPVVVAEDRLVERMGHLADQSGDRVPGQTRIAVQRDHVAHVGRHPRGVAVDGDIGGIVGTPQQTIELGQLAALALPAHPAAFAGVVDPAAVKQQEARAGRAGAMAAIETRHGIDGDGQQDIVAGQFGGVGVAAVQQQGKGQVAVVIGKTAVTGKTIVTCKIVTGKAVTAGETVATGEIVHLETFDQLAQRHRLGQHRRYRDQGSLGGRHAVLECQAGQRFPAEPRSQRAIDQRRRDLVGGQQNRQQPGELPEERQPGGAQRPLSEPQQ